MAFIRRYLTFLFMRNCIHLHLVLPFVCNITHFQFSYPHNLTQYNKYNTQVKTEGLALMEALSSKLYIAKRTITATPSVTIYGTDEAADLEEAEKAKARNAVLNDNIPMLGLFADDSQEPVSRRLYRLLLIVL